MLGEGRVGRQGEGERGGRVRESSLPPRIYSSDFKMDVYLRISRLYLEEQDHVSAESYINRAALLQSEVANKELHIIYRVRQ